MKNCTSDAVQISSRRLLVSISATTEWASGKNCLTRHHALKAHWRWTTDKYSIGHSSTNLALQHTLILDNNLFYQKGCAFTACNPGLFKSVYHTIFLHWLLLHCNIVIALNFLFLPPILIPSHSPIWHLADCVLVKPHVMWVLWVLSRLQANRCTQQWIWNGKAIDKWTCHSSHFKAQPLHKSMDSL